MSTPDQIEKSRACLCVASLLLLLAACASQQPANEQAVEGPATEDGTVDRLSAAPSTRSSQQSDPLLSEFVIHFDFDDSSVRPSYQRLIVAHGRYLADNRTVSLRLEGHADERGTREYNLGLGERRASSVRQLLLLQGARNDQIELLSYGEERPVIAASNERSWQQNRRVELAYTSD